jgi:uncharacterized protein YdaU (DUF1376 family)
VIWYKFHLGDYITHTTHLSDAEDLAYRRLLDLYYMSEKPIPTDTAVVARKIRLDLDITESVLEEFFEYTEEGYRNPRCDAEIAKYHRQVETNREIGKRGGRPPKTVMETESVTSSNPNKIQNKNKNINTPSSAMTEFDTFWKIYPKKVGKDAARKAFEKRNPDDKLLAAMIRAVRSQMDSDAWKADGGKYIPHPTTWLNQGRWQDGETEEKPWWETRSGVEEMAMKIGMPRWSQMTPFDQYRNMIIEAAKEAA